jgi:hypothetical protein
MEVRMKKKLFVFIILIVISIISEIFFRDQQISNNTFEVNQEAVISAIDQAIKSLKENPNQFHLSVTTTGLNINQSGTGGTGMIVKATGGAPGSQVTGLNIAVDGGEINVARQAVNDALREESRKAIQILEELKLAIENQKPDANRVKAIIKDLNETYIPPIVTSLISKLITSWLGLK